MGTVPERGVSSRAIRGPRLTRPSVCGGKLRCFAESAAAGVLLHTSFVRGRRRPLRKGGWETTQWEGNRGARAPTARCSAPPRVFASPRSPSATPRSSRVFCKGAHPGKLVNEVQGARVLRCVALVAARPTAVARAAKCTDSAPGGGSAAAGPAPRPRAEAGCPTRTELTLTGLVRGNAT